VSPNLHLPFFFRARQSCFCGATAGAALGFGIGLPLTGTSWAPAAKLTRPSILPCYALPFIPLGRRIFAALSLPFLVVKFLLATTTSFHLLIGMQQL